MNTVILRPTDWTPKTCLTFLTELAKNPKQLSAYYSDENNTPILLAMRFSLENDVLQSTKYPLHTFSDDLIQIKLDDGTIFVKYKNGEFYIPKAEELQLPSIKHQFILRDYEDEEAEKERKVILNKTFKYNDLPFTFK